MENTKKMWRIINEILKKTKIQRSNNHPHKYKWG